ncbi:hypothetical protein C7999DRAFT_31894 [Corynascus novoguineensis]|uniref:Transmembrane protein n=1 Tax=Corynascus novoguineensis TaxID=1126955 RepID=A0AAN7CTG8_9PEZI|nr:hypothetical protein C7999DRAFT_31894 [Corynascus novoguineensis]
MPTNSRQSRNNHSGNKHGGNNYNPDYHRRERYVDELDELFPCESTSTAPIPTPAPNNNLVPPQGQEAPAQVQPTSIISLPETTGHDDHDHPDPRSDLLSWWSVFFFKRGYSWRWFSRPRLYFPPGLEYKPWDDLGPVTFVDGRGREKTFDKPFDCYIDPFTGKIETLYVQAPYSICEASATSPNATWNRTPIRNVSPMSLRIANLPFRFVTADRRANLALYTPKDWLIVFGMWIPAVAALMLFMLTMDDVTPAAKDKTKAFDTPVSRATSVKIENKWHEA